MFSYLNRSWQWMAKKIYIWRITFYSELDIDNNIIFTLNRNASSIHPISKRLRECRFILIIWHLCDLYSIYLYLLYNFTIKLNWMQIRMNDMPTNTQLCTVQGLFELFTLLHEYVTAIDSSKNINNSIVCIKWDLWLRNVSEKCLRRTK